jgi:hypothetical protein
MTSKVATEIIEHSNNTNDEFGWTGCYIRNETTFPIKNKKINLKEFADLLFTEGFSEYESVTTGYSSKVFRCKNTRAFRKNSLVLCVEFNGDNIQKIWHASSPYQIDNNIYKNFLLSISDKYNLLLADWWKSIIVDISNSKEIDRYFMYDE